MSISNGYIEYTENDVVSIVNIAHIVKASYSDANGYVILYLTNGSEVTIYTNNDVFYTNLKIALRAYK